MAHKMVGTTIVETYKNQALERIPCYVSSEVGPSTEIVWKQFFSKQYCDETRPNTYIPLHLKLWKSYKQHEYNNNSRNSTQINNSKN